MIILIVRVRFSYSHTNVRMTFCFPPPVAVSLTSYLSFHFPIILSLLPHSAPACIALHSMSSPSSVMSLVNINLPLIVLASPAVRHSCTPDPSCLLVISSVYIDLYFCLYVIRMLITFPEPATSLKPVICWESWDALRFHFEFTLSPSDLFSHLNCYRTLLLFDFDYELA